MGAIVSKVLFPFPKPPDYECDNPNLYWIPCRDKARHHIPCLIFTQRKARFLLIYVHGNACDLGSVYNEVRYVSDFLGVHLIAMELRGYGLSQGTPSEKAINDDLTELYSFLTNVLRFPAGRIIFFGRSIGTGPTTRLISILNRRGVRPAGLVLQSPYTSILNVSRHLAGIAADFVVAERWRNIDQIRAVRSPLLIIHGKLDSLIPYSMAAELYNVCPAKRKVLVLPETSDHNTFNLYNDILRPVAAFIRTHCRADAREADWARKVTAKKTLDQKDEDKKSDSGSLGRDIEPVGLQLPKFLKDVPFYAWERHHEFKSIMERLRKAKMSHQVNPIITRRHSNPAITPSSPALDPDTKRSVIPTANPGLRLSFSASRTLSGASLKALQKEAENRKNAAEAAEAVTRASVIAQREREEKEENPEWSQWLECCETALDKLEREESPKHAADTLPIVGLVTTTANADTTEKDEKDEKDKEGSLKERVYDDLQVLGLIRALEGTLLCGLNSKAASLDPPSFWPVVVDAAKACSKRYEATFQEFSTDVRYIASQELEPSEAHCSLGRAWLKHLLNENHLHSSLETISSLTPLKSTQSDKAEASQETEFLVKKWYTQQSVMLQGGRIRQKLMALALRVDEKKMDLQIELQ
ncbi:hypothetical protein AAMO2058_000128000 [Amorphochlora amoebiformis]